MAIGDWGHSITMTIHINNLTLTYDRHPAVHHLTTTIGNGEWLAIVGPNGAGKSTLLSALSGLGKINQGSIDGVSPDEIAYLPQQTRLDNSFPISVFELVSTGLWSTLGFFKPLTQAQHLRCKNALKTVGLQGFEHRMIHTLSGGQLQRALFARVLLQDQPVILLDEPFNAIDAKTLADLTRVIQQWHQQERTIIMVTHDLEYVQQYCPQTLLLARECIGHGSTPNIITKDNLRRAKQLSESFDDQAQWCQRRVG